MLTASKTVAAAVEAMKQGASDYVTKPFEPEALRIKILALLEHGELVREVARLRDRGSRTARSWRACSDEAR